MNAPKPEPLVRHVRPMTFIRRIDPNGKVTDFFLCGCCGAWRDVEGDQSESPPPYCTACLKHGHAPKRPAGGG